MKSRMGLIVCAATSLGLAGAASAEIELRRASLQADYKFAVRLDNANAQWSRVTVKPQGEWRLNSSWRAQVSARFEFADDEVGLGNVDGFSDFSRPAGDGRGYRVELDEATLIHRGNQTRTTIGKQSIAWGVLDGLRVTDRMDAVRLRDFVYAEQQPDRIKRWGIMHEHFFSDWELELGVLLDPSSDQLANFDDAYFPRLPGLSLESATSPPVISTKKPDPGLSNPTVGFRATRSLPRGTLSALVISGPDSEPVIGDVNFESGVSRINLTTENRNMVGVSYEVPFEDQIWRVEAAYSPDQIINTVSSGIVDLDQRGRIRFGTGVDFNAADSWFVNAQIALDQLQEGGDAELFAASQLIATLLITRTFSNETIQTSLRYSGSLVDGDGTLKPSVGYQLNDAIELSFGADLAFGDRKGRFGQFRTESAVWLKIGATL